MCLIAFAWQQHPDYPLIVIANRDEFYHRASNNLHLWSQNRILAGRDLKAGGTWMGCTTDGRWAAVTNVRDGNKQKRTNYISRGKLVQAFLESDHSVEQHLEQLKRQATYFDGFNLLFGDRQKLAWFSNQNLQAKILEPGNYGLSNAALNSNWPKLEKTRHALHQFTRKIPTSEKPDSPKTQLDTNHLLELLENSERAPQNLLPDTGINPDLESKLSSTFIQLEDYGTRCSSILFFSKDYLQFTEAEHSPKRKRVREKTFRCFF